MPDSNYDIVDAPDAKPRPFADQIGSAIAQVGGNLASDYHDRVHEAADALMRDIRGSSDPGERLAEAESPLGMGGKVAMDAANYALSPASAVVDWAIGRPVEALTGGRVNRREVGDIAMMALPGGAEVVSEARLAKAAREAGVSTEALRANLKARARASEVTAQERKTRQGAAKTLINHGGLNSANAGQKAGDLLREHQESGVPQKPRLLDILSKDGQRVVRVAGTKLGEAGDTLESHRHAMRLGTAEEATQRTEAMSPHTQSVEARQKELTEKRDALANTKYRAPYAHPIESDERLFDILNFKEGPAIVRQAMDDAQRRALDDPDSARQYHELKALTNYQSERAAYEQAHAEWEGAGKGKFAVEPTGVAKETLENPNTSEAVKERLRREHGWKTEPEPQPPRPPTLSGGSLDRVRRLMNDRADKMSKAGSRSAAGGIGERRNKLDAYLDDVPHLKEARAEYRDYSQRIEQLDFQKNLATMRPNSFEDYVKDLTPEQRQELVHKIFQSEAARMGGSSRSMQSREDIMTTGPNMRANLRTLLGPEEADRYLRAMDLIGRKIDAANFVAPGVGSKTAGLTNDMTELGAKVGLATLQGAHHRLIHIVGDFLMRRITGMSEEKAQRIAEWAVQEKDVMETVGEIMEAATSKIDKGPSKIPDAIKKLLPAAGLAAGVGAAESKPEQPAAAPKADDKSAGDYEVVDPPATAKPDGQDQGSPSDQPAPTGNSDFDSLMHDYAPGVAPSSYEHDDQQPLLDTVRRLEGSGDQAVSPAGAIGRYQIMPDTAKQYGFDPQRLKDPAYNEQAAKTILADLSDRYGGDTGAILVAYNAGPRHADQWLASGRDPSVLPQETVAYLQRAGLLEGGGGEAPEESEGDLAALVGQYAPGAV